jgi:uncharacterized protein with HEPN domain
MKRSEALRKLNAHAGAIKALGAISLYLFGSTARNKANAGSDIDLFIDLRPVRTLQRPRFGRSQTITGGGSWRRGGPHHAQRAPSVGSQKGRGRGNAAFLDGRPLALATHPRHVRKHSRNRKGHRRQSLSRYQRSWLLRSAIERGIEVISEASRHLGRDLKAQHEDVRWKDIAGIGNILRHEYRHIDAAIIWRTVKNDLPPLKDALLALKASLK